MQTLIIKTVAALNSFNEWLFSPLDSFIDKIPLAHWVADAIKDSFHMLPFLFFIFVVIEIIEYFYSNKMTQLAKYSSKAGPIVGSLAASFPQCGFSVIASTLYSKRLITQGTLIAVFLSTSDEAIPVILSEPTKMHLIVPILIAKIFIGITTGYLIDFLLKRFTNEKSLQTVNNDIEIEEGCCKHHVHNPRKRDLLIHPLDHTLNVFVFILLVTIGLNYLVFIVGGEENLGGYFLNNSIWQPIITAVAGLIPNCAISIAITLMYIKGAIGFGSVISGLCSSAGLGLLVLLKKNTPFKDSLKIILMLLSVSIFWGIIIQCIYN